MRFVVAAVFCACVAAATPFSANPARSAPACASQIIVTFKQPLDGQPDEALVTSLANAARIRLAFLRSAGPGLYVFTLAGAESASSCPALLERLRRDPRIRSAEIDVRRKPYVSHF